MASNVERLSELTDDLSVSDIMAVFDLLQEDHNGQVKPFSEKQIEQMNSVVPNDSLSITSDAEGTVNDDLKKTKSKMSNQVAIASCFLANHP